MLAWLLHIANSSPIDKRAFYPVKTMILQRFGIKDGLDLQELAGKRCWSCDGSGIFVHTYSGDEECCDRCGGNGWYKSPCYVTLQRWELGRYVFHEPIDRKYCLPPSGIIVRSFLTGYVDHRHYSYRSRLWASFLLGLMFDRDLATIAWPQIVRRYWIVQFWRKRCIDCKRHIWRKPGFRCNACEYIRARDKPEHFDEAPF